MKGSSNLFVKAGLSVVILSWLVYTAYRFEKSVSWFVEHFIYQVPMTIQEPLVVDIMGTVGLGFRTAAALIALVSFFIFLRGREPSRLVKLVSVGVLLEAIYFLTFIPAAIYFVFLTSMLLLLVETGVPIMAQAIVMPIVLLRLRSKLVSPAGSYVEVVKWACIVGVSYLFVFWLNFSMQWFGTFIMPEIYSSAYPGYGISYVLDYPLNMFSFLLTLVGLLLLMVFFVWSSTLAMKGYAEKLSLKRVGVTLTAFGGYFLLIYLLFLVFGPVGGYSLWNAVFIHHSVDLWCATLPALGIPLLFR